MSRIFLKHTSTIYFIFLLAIVIVGLLSFDIPFFWDAISKSKRAQWILDNNFSQIILPPDFDSGHPPLFLLYLAAAWSFLGKSLLVSHIIMLPFLVGVGYQLIILVKRFIDEKYHAYCLLLLFLEPTLLAQMTNMHTDIILLFLYLAGINAVLSNNRTLIILTVAFVSLINMRGMIFAFAIFISDLAINFSIYKQNRKAVLNRLFVYIIAIIPLLIWLFYHFEKTGWILFTPSENWNMQRKPLGIKGMLKNIAIIIKNLLDFGRILFWLLLGILILILFKKRKRISLQTKKLVFIIAIPLLLFSLGFIPFSNPIGHRYYLVIYVLSIILGIHLLRYTRFRNGMMPIILMLCIAASFVCGQFWIYPEKIAQGWDSSLAHLPYFKLRDKMDSYIEENNIPTDEIGTKFPYSAQQFTHLNNKVQEFHSAGLDTSSYIIYSNIMNDYSDEEIDEITTNWILVNEYNTCGVFLRLYENPVRSVEGVIDQ